MNVLLGSDLFFFCCDHSRITCSSSGKRVTGIASLGSFGVVHCSSGHIHVCNQGYGNGLIQDYATNVLGESFTCPGSHPVNSGILGICFFCCSAPFVVGGTFHGGTSEVGYATCT